ncbi:MAG: CoA ester lyase [Clostridiales bacterium]|nr:CoA ester lyase [Clostridiales bacterium]
MFKQYIRRSLLFIPGNKPQMHFKAASLGADAVIFDLEDSINPSEKDEARQMVINALAAVSFSCTEVIVRINNPNTEAGLKDIYSIAPMRPQAFMIPKACEKSMAAADKILSEIEKQEEIPVGEIKLFALIETAYGVENIYSVIKSASRVTGVLFGAEDFTSDMQISRTESGDEIFYARSRVAICCRACGVDAIDTPYTDVKNMAGLVMDTRKARSLGMTGKSAIHPCQIECIHHEFKPSEEEVRYAERVIEAFSKTNNTGGVFLLDGKMIDAPIVKRAERVMHLSGS